MVAVEQDPFDLIDHTILTILLSKLRSCNLNPCLVRWIAAYVLLTSAPRMEVFPKGLNWGPSCSLLNGQRPSEHMA